MYEEYFDMLLKLKFNEGFTLEDTSWTELDWLYKHYPVAHPERIYGLATKPKLLILTEVKWAFGRIFRRCRSTRLNLRSI